ncbi:cAMP-regulated phosphoprotein/endosulfine region [Oesophagostomum dentatum]|uniref:cAMP-regulated phosphoprotein/endosulfine region n=1 Tax=Oesophagostomum dentatum TaxID=61180 RepID=A0A0B1SB33_OESDE|nr:cAMP-regulated phosphoprotein/endosulfine region [Oesophagostomum dentatum]
MRSEVSGEMPEDLAEGLSVEKQQEQQLMNKLAAQGRLPARPASSFLQKKLQQRKFFDSGDYAMDKDRSKQAVPGRLPHPMAAPVTAAIPVAKAPSPGAAEPSSPEAEPNLQIPRPDTVPQRKASIINPAVHCKLSPMPHVQVSAYLFVRFPLILFIFLVLYFFSWNQIMG